MVPLEQMWIGGGDMPQITLRRDIEFMQFHPIVSSSLDYYRAGISGAEFWGGPDNANPDNAGGKPISPDPRVAEFVLAHVERFWQRGVPLLQEGGYTYGWAGGEHIYKEVGGLMVWSHLKDFHPNDCFILTGAVSTPIAYHPLGARVKGLRGRPPVEMWFAEGHIPAKAAWYAHRPRFGQFYGRSQLTGAWRAWRRLGWRDGVEQVIDAAVYRAGYQGPVVGFPPGHSAPTARQGVPATTQDGGGLSRRENRDVARQILEWMKAGAGVAISSEQYPPTQGGGPKWNVDFPDHVMDVRPLVDTARYLEEQIILGIGVPPELIRSGGTGSGYSGRSIPREAFLDQQQRIADRMLQIFVEQVVRPLVLWNFGDVPFEVSCKSLLKSQADDKSAGGAEGGVDPKRSQAAKKAWEIRKQSDPSQVEGAETGGGAPTSPEPIGQPASTVPGAGGGAPMSLGTTLDPRALEIVRRVLVRKGAA